MLERLGPPDEIVAASGLPQRRSGRLELAAMIALSLPFLGWLVGIVLVAASRAWSGREKALGIMIVLIPVVVMGLGFIAAGTETGADVPVPTGPGTLPAEQTGGDGGGLGPIELAVILGILLCGPLAAVYLGSRLRHRPESGELVSA